MAEDLVQFLSVYKRRKIFPGKERIEEHKKWLGLYSRRFFLDPRFNSRPSPSTTLVFSASKPAFRDASLLLAAFSTGTTLRAASALSSTIERDYITFIVTSGSGDVHTSSKLVPSVCGLQSPKRWPLKLKRHGFMPKIGGNHRVDSPVLAWSFLICSIHFRRERWKRTWLVLEHKGFFGSVREKAIIIYLSDDSDKLQSCKTR